MAVVFSDDFNRADGAPGGNWTGALEIVSNQARMTGFNAQYAINTTPPGTADYDVQVALSQGTLSGGGAIGFGVVARYQDSNNFYLLWVDSGAVAYILYAVVGGGYTEKARYTFGSPNANPVTLRLSCQGSAIKIFVNGTERVSSSDSSLTAAGNFGLRSFNPDSSHRWDNLQVETAALAAVVAQRWTGSAWTPATVQRWNGSGWTPAVVKRWNGSGWV